MTNESKSDHSTVLVTPRHAIICRHCGAPIFLTMISGLSLVCSACNKPQNGRMRLTAEQLHEDA